MFDYVQYCQTRLNTNHLIAFQFDFVQFDTPGIQGLYAITTMGDPMAKLLARWTPDQTVRVQALAWVIVLCS